MKRMFVFAAFLAVCVLAGTHAANAQATRTWVSGVGDDTNPCSRTAPCKTLQGAFSKTAVNGEINCIDTGGFGPLSINHSISVICDNTEAGILPGSGSAGVTISAAVTDTVFLSGLDFNGIGGSATGIHVVSVGSLTVRNTTIRNFITGISVTPTGNTALVNVFDTTVSDNTGEGIFNKPGSGGFVRMMLDRTRLTHNGGDGLIANGNGGGSIKVSIRNCEAANNGADGFVAFSSSGVSQLLIDASSAFNNTVSGLHATGTNATVRFTRSTITANATGVLMENGGTAVSFLSNTVQGNQTDGTFTTMNPQ